MGDRPRISPELGWPHVSDHAPRGYVEYDPIVRISNERKPLTGAHGLMDIRAEITRTAYDAGVLDTPLFRKILDP